jgi:hypothetical protein
MRAPAAALCMLAMTAARGVLGADAEPSAAPSLTDQRLVFTTSGSTLTGGSGGAAGSATWVGNFTGNVIGAGVEYQQIANAHWTAGSFSGSVAPGLRTHLYVEAHEGAGDVGDHAFHYSLIAAGFLSQLTSRLSVQLEERRIDIDTSHGNLPKLGLSFQVTPRLQASVSYAYSLGGNLGTRLGLGRIDYSGGGLTALAGIAGGPVAPAVIDLVGHVVAPGPRLKEGFLGVGKPLRRTDWLLIGDYQDVAGFKRTTIALTCTVHLRAHEQPR